MQQRMLLLFCLSLLFIVLSGAAAQEPLGGLYIAGMVNLHLLDKPSPAELKKNVIKRAFSFGMGNSFVEVSICVEKRDKEIIPNSLCFSYGGQGQVVLFGNNPRYGNFLLPVQRSLCPTDFRKGSAPFLLSEGGWIVVVLPEDRVAFQANWNELPFIGDTLEQQLHNAYDNSKVPMVLLRYTTQPNSGQTIAPEIKREQRLLFSTKQPRFNWYTKRPWEITTQLTDYQFDFIRVGIHPPAFVAFTGPNLVLIQVPLGFACMIFRNGKQIHKQVSLGAVDEDKTQEYAGTTQEVSVQPDDVVLFLSFNMQKRITKLKVEKMMAAAMAFDMESDIKTAMESDRETVMETVMKTIMNMVNDCDAVPERLLTMVGLSAGDINFLARIGDEVAKVKRVLIHHGYYNAESGVLDVHDEQVAALKYVLDEAGYSEAKVRLLSLAAYYAGRFNDALDMFGYADVDSSLMAITSRHMNRLRETLAAADEHDAKMKRVDAIADEYADQFERALPITKVDYAYLKRASTATKEYVAELKMALNAAKADDADLGGVLAMADAHLSNLKKLLDMPDYQFADSVMPANTSDYVANLKKIVSWTDGQIDNLKGAFNSAAYVLFYQNSASKVYAALLRVVAETSGDPKNNSASEPSSMEQSTG